MDQFVYPTYIKIFSGYASKLINLLPLNVSVKCRKTVSEIKLYLKTNCENGICNIMSFSQTLVSDKMPLLPYKGLKSTERVFTVL